MAEHIWQTEIDKDTPRQILEQVVVEVARTSDPNVQRKAGEAKAEINRRDQEFRRTLLHDELNGRSTINTAHIRALDRLNKEQITATENLNQKQLRIATASAWAAGFAASAAIALVVFNAIALFVKN